MKSLLFTAILSVSALAAEPAQTALPAEPAYSAVLVHQCGSAIVIVATMEDGKVLTFDMRTTVPWADQYAWFQKAKTHISVEAKCILGNGDIST